MTRPRGPAAAVLALHWQVNVIKPEGFFGGMLAEPVARSGVVARAAEFHAAAQGAGAGLVFTRFTVPGDEGSLVRNTAFMRAVADSQEMFRPQAPGAQLIPEMAGLAGDAHVAGNQKLSGLAGNDVVRWLLDRSISTVFITGVATNLTVEQTARHGTDLGLTVYVVSDCVAAADEATHAASLANLELTTAGCLTAGEALEKIRSLGWPAPSVPNPSGSGFGLNALAPGDGAPGSPGPEQTAGPA
jgi:biuret amidohydrolase